MPSLLLARHDPGNIKVIHEPPTPGGSCFLLSSDIRKKYSLHTVIIDTMARGEYYFHIIIIDYKKDS